MQKKYSLGLIFTPDFQHVLLLHKLKPDWQKGKINGIGGKIEDGETALACIVREVKEETDLTTKASGWQYIANMTSSYFFTEVFTCVYAGEMNDAKRMIAEPISWFDTNNLPENMMNNLYWLIPLAMDKLKHGEPKTVVVTY